LKKKKKRKNFINKIDLRNSKIKNFLKKKL